MKLIWGFLAAVLMLLVIGFKVDAQNQVYVRTIYKVGGTAPISALGIALDHNTNTYTLGQFTAATTIGSTLLTNAGGWPNIFVGRSFFTFGSGYWWRAPVTDYTIYNAKIGCDSKGDSYLAGTFGGTNLTFSTTTLTNYASDHSGDIFFAKYDGNGNVKLLSKLGGTGNDVLGDLITDTNGNCFLTGVFQSPTFTAGTSNLVQLGTGAGDCFTAKYDTNGNVLWLEQGSNARGTCLALDSSTNCYVGGYVTGPAVFDGYSLTNAATTNFLAKYYYGGGLAWVRGDLNLGKFIGLDAAQNIYTAGTFSNSVQFGSLTLRNGSASTVYVAKYDPNGNVLWATQLPGMGNDAVTAMVIDSLTNCWISGYFASPSSPSNTVAFVAQFTPTGTLAAVSQISSPMSQASALATIKGPNGPAVFACGSYATNFNFYGHSITNAGNTDIFTAWVLSPPAVGLSTTRTNLVVTWPNTDSNLVLESSSDMASWATVTNPISIVNGQRVVTNAMNRPSGYFRLRLQ